MVAGTDAVGRRKKGGPLRSAAEETQNWALKRGTQVRSLGRLRSDWDESSRCQPYWGVFYSRRDAAVSCLQDPSGERQRKRPLTGPHQGGAPATNQSMSGHDSARKACSARMTTTMQVKGAREVAASIGVTMSNGSWSEETRVIPSEPSQGQIP